MDAAAVGYGAGARFQRDTVRRLAGGRLNRLTTVLRKRGLLALTCVRLVPLGPFAVQNVVAGAVRVRFLHFLIATFIGMLPGTLATTIFGDQLRGAALGSRRIDGTLLLIVAAALLAGALLVRRLLTRVDAAAPPAPLSAPAPALPRAPEGA